MKIRLPELVDAMRKTDVHQGYVDLKKGRIILLEDTMDEDATLDHIFSVEEDWQRYVMLPDDAAEEERKAMARFAKLQQGSPAGEQLAEVLKGTHRRTRFRRLVKELNLSGKWKSFRDLHFLAVARAWCRENGIEYEN